MISAHVYFCLFRLVTASSTRSCLVSCIEKARSVAKRLLLSDEYLLFVRPSSSGTLFVNVIIGYV